jgi:hypothetical protein
MLFMDIWTWEPERRDEVEKRAAVWKCPEGIRAIGLTSPEIEPSIFMR